MNMAMEFIIRLVIAGAMGALIGLDREYRAKEAGYRTHFLVSLGSALIMIVSQYGFADVLGKEGVGLDPSRIAAQVVSGIGFIGAGTIILNKQIVRGLTTAAGIWATAGIGLAIGSGMYVLGISATILTLIGLEVLSLVFKNVGIRNIAVEFSTHSRGTLNAISKKFSTKDYYIVSYQMDEQPEKGMTRFHVSMVIKCRKRNGEATLAAQLQEYGDTTIHLIE